VGGGAIHRNAEREKKKGGRRKIERFGQDEQLGRESTAGDDAGAPYCVGSLPRNHEYTESHVRKEKKQSLFNTL